MIMNLQDLDFLCIPHVPMIGIFAIKLEKFKLVTKFLQYLMNINILKRFIEDYVLVALKHVLRCSWSKEHSGWKCLVGFFICIDLIER